MGDDMDKTILLGFPLVAMLLIAVVSLGDITGASSEEFYTVREVDNDQLEAIDNYCNDAYDYWGEDPRDYLDGGSWLFTERHSFLANVNDLLYDIFSDNDDVDSADEYKYISGDLLSYMGSLYADALDRRINENEIETIIEVDPVSRSEWEELSDARIRITDTLVFIAVFVGLIVLIGIVGIRIFGSGLAETSVSSIVTITSFLLLWGLLSAFGYGLLNDIPVLGTVVWIALTFMYMLGVIFTITDAGD